MKIIKLENRVIYRADADKKVKWTYSDTLYSEISTKKETNQIVEVEANE